ncbi:hypothetical protein [Deinococcus humi]|uniref:Uncharacterized protein n=1 Tax=Deinococcus humi TaxID=662880 RepID=A0A7W8NCJ6_9DEIO|nr:hypothetical protein [Deinococcus humi]MBB5361381.1 hypothetical protein [Deinococcus humi]GGO19793.1 hypothetical protein GCM10008949_04440 [Deinococcus humi]
MTRAAHPPLYLKSITTRDGSSVSAALTRALASADPVTAFDARCEVRDARRQERLAAQGMTHSRCDRCNRRRVLSWEGGECTEHDPNTDSGMCEGIYRAAPDTLSLSNGLGGVAQVRYSVNGARV